MSPSEASRRLIASESMNDLSPPKHVGHNDIDIKELSHITPPGTPPPPYPVSTLGHDIFSSTLNDVHTLLIIYYPNLIIIHILLILTNLVTINVRFIFNVSTVLFFTCCRKS